MKTRLSFRIPAILLAVFLLSSSLIYLQEESANQESIRQNSINELKFHMSGLQNVLYNRLTQGDQQEALLSLSLTATHPDIRVLILADNNGKILMSNRYGWKDHDAGEISRFDQAVAGNRLQTSLNHMSFNAKDGNVLQGYFPLITEYKSGGLEKTMGVLYVEFDIASELNAAHGRAIHQVLNFGVIMLIAALMISNFLHQLVTRRVKALIDTSARFATGDMSARTGFTGKDELAMLGRSLDDMAQKLSDNIALQNNLIRQLGREQALLVEAQKIANFGSWELDIVSGQLHWSEEIFRIFEIDPYQFGASYEAFLNAIHPDDRESVNQAYTHSIANKQPYEITHRLLMADGRIKWVIEHCETYYKEQSPIRSAGTVQDITKQKEMEMALHENEVKLQSILNASAVAVAWADEHGAIKYCNDTFTHMFGYTLEDTPTIEQWYLHAYPDPGYRENMVSRWNEIIAQAQRKGTTIFSPFELDVTCKDGSIKNVVLTGSWAGPLLLANFSDITPLKMAQKAAQEQAAQYRMAIETSVDGFLTVNMQGQLTQANAAYARMSGYSSEELLSMRVSDIEALERAEETAARMVAIRRDGFVRFESEHKKKDGSVFPVQVVCSFSPLAGGQIYAFVTDLTERHKKDALLMQQSRMATMGEMIGNIAHQWRQPINALGLILFDLEDASKHGQLDDKYLHDAVTTSHVLIQKMSSTIDDFKNFFRTDNIPSTFSLEKVIRESLEIMDATLKHHHISVAALNFNGHLVFGRANDLSQAIINLLANAKDAIVHHNVARGEIVIEITEDEHYGIVTISDNGGGIPPNVLPKIFEPYFTTKADGVGIGLYMTHMSIVKNMGGTIQAENFAQGARFTIKIPREDQGGIA